MLDILPNIEINPTKSPIGSVIWLHGLGADGNDFVPIVPELNLPESCPLRFVFPNAPSIPVTINNGYIMPAWYDITSLSLDQRADQAGILKSVGQVQQLVEREEKLGIPADKIILAGFSQGAVIALTTGLTFPKRLGGILALSGYLPQPEVVMQKADPLNKATPIFLGHGIQDPVVPLFLGEAINQILTAHHYSVSWHRYMMAHSVCATEIKDIGVWLGKIF